MDSNISLHQNTFCLLIPLFQELVEMPLYFHRGEKVVPVGMQLFRETWPHQMARILLMKATKEGCFACCEKVSLQFCFPGEDLGKLPITLLHWYWKSGGVFL